MLQGQLVWQAGAWGVYREIRACCLLARLKLDEELQLGRVFFSWKAEIAAGAISLFHWSAAALPGCFSSPTLAHKRN